MEERKMIESKKYKIKRLLILLLIACLIIVGGLFVLDIKRNSDYYGDCFDVWFAHEGGYYCRGYYSELKCKTCQFMTVYESSSSYAFDVAGEYMYMLIIPVALIVLTIVLGSFFSKYRMTVTDKRVYGNAALGKNVEFPIESIVGVSCNHALKCVSIATASGRNVFFNIDNAEEIFAVINSLLYKKQKKAADM